MGRKKGNNNKKIEKQSPPIPAIVAVDSLPSESPKKAIFTLILEVNNQIYKTSGETILDCLNAIPLDYVQIKSKGTVSIESGNNKIEKFFPLLFLRKIIASKMMKTVWSKNFNVLMR